MSPNQKSTVDPRQSGGQAPQNPSQQGTPEWLYDEIMRHIEPDLLTTVIPTHIEKYKNETAEERKERMTAYDKAFAIFDTVAAEFEGDFHIEYQKVRKDAQEKVATEEKKEVQKIGDEIDSSEQ